MSAGESSSVPLRTAALTLSFKYKFCRVRHREVLHNVCQWVSDPFQIYEKIKINEVSGMFI